MRALSVRSPNLTSPMRHALRVTCFLVVIAAAARPAAAQIDLSGEWAGTFYEDPHPCE